jgi:hypothetical protein
MQKELPFDRTGAAGRSLHDPALRPERIQDTLNRIRDHAIGEEAVRGLLREMAMRELEGRDVPNGRGAIREAGKTMGLDVDGVEEQAREEYVPPRAVAAQVPSDTSFPYVHVALALSRQQWPPEPRRGDRYSDTQLREEIAHGAKRLPLKKATDRFGAGHLIRKATSLGLPEALFEGRSSWSPGQTYVGLCRDLVRPLHPEKYSVLEVESTPAAVKALTERKVFEKIEGEIELWDWTIGRAEEIAQVPSAPRLFETLKETKEIGPTATSTGRLGKYLLYYCQGVTLGKTVFGSSQKTPPYARTADYEKEIPRFHTIWRGEADVSFREALRRRRAYEGAIEKAETAAERRAAEALRRDVEKVLFPFFDWHVDNGWSTESLSALSRKWAEYFDEDEAGPKLHRSSVSGEIVIEGEGVGRRYRSPEAGAADSGSEVQALVHYVGHMRRLLLLRAVEERRGVHRLLRDARKAATQDLSRGRSADELYQAVGELMVDRAIARPQVETPVEGVQDRT